MIGFPRRRLWGIGVTWHARCGMDDPARCLLAAIIHTAVRDAVYGSNEEAADALAYLHGSNFETDCAWLDLEPAYIRKRLKEEARLK